MHRFLQLCFLLLLSSQALSAERPSSADQNDHEPEEVFLQYVQACKKGKLKRAAGHVWLRDGQTAKDEAHRFEQVYDRIRDDKWHTRILAKAVDLPYAVIIFTTREDRSNPEPVFLLQVDGVWKLHHTNVSGGLRHRLPESDMEKVSGLLRWGNQKTGDLMTAVKARANAAADRANQEDTK